MAGTSNVYSSNSDKRVARLRHDGKGAVYRFALGAHHRRPNVLPRAAPGQARTNGPPTEQLTLPMRHGGLGVAHTGPEEGDAAYLSAVATTQLAMRRGPAEFRPFDGPSDAQFCLQWEGLHDTAEALWRPEDREVSQDSMGTIAEAQHAYCRHSAQARTDALLASLHDGTEGGKRARARLLSCACRPASAWLDTLPLSRALELKSGEF
jgi:hypothetical protein